MRLLSLCVKIICSVTSREPFKKRQRTKTAGGKKKIHSSALARLNITFPRRSFNTFYKPEKADINVSKIRNIAIKLQLDYKYYTNRLILICFTLLTNSRRTNNN